MGQIQAGTNYNTGNNKIVTATNLNNHVNNAVLLEGAISQQTNITENGPAQPDDQLLIRDVSANTLNKITVSEFNAIPTDKNAHTFTCVNLEVDSNNGVGGSADIENVINVGINYITEEPEVQETNAGAFVVGKFEHISSGATRIAAGTTEQRNLVTIPTDGHIRYNTDSKWLEAYDSELQIWKQVGYSPFEASGGNIILEPSANAVAATLTSVDGINFTVTVPTGHDINMGQVVEIKMNNQNQSGYNGEYVVSNIPNTFDVVLRRRGAPIASAAGAACTIRKSGNHKVHIFLNSGNFIVGSSDGKCDVLVLGAGGGRGSGHRWHSTGGGSGGCAMVKEVKIEKNTTYQVAVGLGVGSGKGGLSEIKKLGTSSKSFIWAEGGDGGVGNKAGSCGATSEGNQIFEGQPIGSTFHDGTNQVGQGAGAGSRGSCWPPQPGGDTFDFPSSTRASGARFDITNIETEYGVGGAGDSGSFRIYTPPELFYGNKMFSPVNGRGFGPRGVGASDLNNNPDDPSLGIFGQSGANGIVIIRYPYKLPVEI